MNDLTIAEPAPPSTDAEIGALPPMPIHGEDAPSSPGTFRRAAETAAFDLAAAKAVDDENEAAFAASPTADARRRLEYHRLETRARDMLSRPDEFQDAAFGAIFNELNSRRFSMDPRLLTAFDRPGEEHADRERLREFIDFTDRIASAQTAADQQAVIGEQYSKGLKDLAAWEEAKKSPDGGAAYAREHYTEWDRGLGGWIRSIPEYPRVAKGFFTGKDEKVRTDKDAIAEYDKTFENDRLMLKAAQMMPFLTDGQRSFVNLAAGGADFSVLSGMLKAMRPEDRDLMLSMAQAVRPEYQDMAWVPDEGFVRMGSSISSAARSFGRWARNAATWLNGAGGWVTGQWYNPLSWQYHAPFVYESGNNSNGNKATIRHRLMPGTKEKLAEMKKGMLEDIHEYEALSQTKFHDPEGFLDKALAGFSDSAPLQASVLAGYGMRRAGERLSASGQKWGAALQIGGAALQGYCAMSMIGEHFDNLLKNGVDMENAVPLAFAGGIVDAWIENWDIAAWTGKTLSADQMRYVGWRAALSFARKHSWTELKKLSKANLRQLVTVTASELGEEIAQAVDKQGVLSYAEGKSLVDAYANSDAGRAAMDALVEALPTCTAFGFTGALDLTGHVRAGAMDAYRRNLNAAASALARQEGADDLDLKARLSYITRVKNAADRVTAATRGMSASERNKWLDEQEDLTPFERAFYAEQCALREAIEAQDGEAYAAAVMSGSIAEGLFAKEGWKFSHDEKGKITAVTTKDGETIPIDIRDRKASIDDLDDDGVAMFIEEWNDAMDEAGTPDKKFSADAANDPAERARIEKAIEDGISASFDPNGGIILYMRNPETEAGGDAKLVHEWMHSRLAALEKSSSREAKRSRRNLSILLGRSWNENAAISAEQAALADSIDARLNAEPSKVDWSGVARNIGEAVKRVATLGMKRGEWSKMFTDPDGNQISPTEYYSRILGSAALAAKEQRERDEADRAERKKLVAQILAEREAKRKARIALRKGERDAKAAQAAADAEAARKEAEAEADRILAERREQERKELEARREEERKNLQNFINRTSGKMPRLLPARHLAERGDEESALAAQRGSRAYQALWKVARKEKLSQEDIDFLADEYGLPPEILTSPDDFSAETTAKFNDALTRLWTDAANVRIAVPPVYVSSEADRSRILPNEVYDPVFREFVNGEVIVDPDKAEPFTPAEAEDAQEVAAQEQAEANGETLPPHVPTPLARRSVQPAPKDSAFDFSVRAKKGETFLKKLAGGFWSLLHKPFDFADGRPAPSAQDASGHGLWTGRRIPPHVAALLKLHGGKCPHYMGNKNAMLERTVKALCDNMTPSERAHYTRLNDCFGGGGCWGLSLALVALPNVKSIIVNEYDENRIEKIRLLHTMDGRMEDALRSFLADNKVIEATDRRLEQIREEGRKRNNNPLQVKQACLEAMKDALSRMSKEERGLLWAFLDDLQHRLAHGKNYDKATGTFDFDALVESAIKRVGADAVKATELAEAFKARGGVITYSAGDAKLQNDFGVRLDDDGVYRRGAQGEALQVPHGSDVMSVADPPYYRTIGYSDEGGKTTVGLAANPTGWGYEDTSAMLRSMVDSGDAIVYTDEAWWLRREYSPSDGALQDEERILGQIVNDFDHFDVAGGVGDRQETLGVQHGHEIRKDDEEVAHGPNGGDADDGRGPADGRGVRPLHGQPVQGLAAGAEGQALGQPGSADRGGRPRFWNGDPATLSDAIANGDLIPKSLRRYADFLLAAAAQARQDAEAAALRKQAEDAYAKAAEKRHDAEQRAVEDFIHPQPPKNTATSVADFIAANGGDPSAYPALMRFTRGGHAMFEVPRSSADPLWDAYRNGTLPDNVKRSLFGAKHGGQGRFDSRTGNDNVLEALAAEYGIEVSSQSDLEAAYERAVAEYEKYLDWKSRGAPNAQDVEMDAIRSDILSKVGEDGWRRHEKAESEMRDVDSMRSFGLIDQTEANNRKIEIAMRPENAEIYRRLGEPNPASLIDDFYTPSGSTRFSVANPSATDAEKRSAESRHAEAVRTISASIAAAEPDSDPAAVDALVRHSVRQVREERMAEYAASVSKNARRWLKDAARRLDERMKAAGFTEKVWHGTGAGEFNSFRLHTHGEPSTSPKLVFFTYYEGTAESYAIESRERSDDRYTGRLKPDVRQFYVNPGRMLTLDASKKEIMPYDVDWDEMIRKAYKDGYNSIRLRNVRDDLEWRYDADGEPINVYDMDDWKEKFPTIDMSLFYPKHYEPGYKLVVTDILIVMQQPGDNAAARIKAADPVTFMDEDYGGMPVPLDMRADRSMPDVRFSVRGKRNLVAVKNIKAADLGGPYGTLVSARQDEAERRLMIDHNMAPWQTEDVPTIDQILVDRQGAMTDVKGNPVARHSVTVNPNLRSDIDDAFKKDKDGHYVRSGSAGVRFSDSASILEFLGIRMNGIFTTVDRVRKMKSKHNLTEDQIAELPSRYEKPIAVFLNTDSKGSHIILTDMMATASDGSSKPVMILLRPAKDKVGGFIASAYSRSADKELLYVSQRKKIAYIDENKIAKVNLLVETLSRLEPQNLGDDVKTPADYSEWSTQHSVPNSAADVNGVQHSLAGRSANTAFRYYLAREIMEKGRAPDSRHAAFMARAFGLDHRPAAVSRALADAQREADEQTRVLRYVASDPKVEQAVARAGRSWRYENAIKRARRSAIKFSRDVSEARENTAKAMERAVRAVRGEDYEEMLTRDGIDLNAILRAIRPAERSAPEPSGESPDSPAPSGVNPTPTPATTAAGRAAAEKAIERARELVAEARRKAAEAEDEETGGATAPTSASPAPADTADTDADDADPAGGLVAEAFRRAIAESGITLDDPASVVQLVKAITERYIHENPEKVSDLDPDDVWASPIARAMLAGNIASFASAVARAYAPSYAQMRVAERIQRLNDHAVNSIGRIEEVAEAIFADMNRDIIRQSRASLIKDIRRIVKNPARHYSDLAEAKDRPVSADTQRYCKFVLWAMNVPQSRLEETARELEDTLNGYARDADTPADRRERYRDYAEAQLKLHLLDTYGNLGSMMPAELTELRDRLAQMVDEGRFDAMCFSEKWENARNAAVEAAVPAVVGDPKNKGVMPEKTSWLYSLVGMFETKWRQLTRFCRDDAVRDRSMTAMSTVEEMIQTSCDRQFNHLQQTKKRLTDTLVAVYGSESKARKALRADIDESLWASLDRGEQHTEWTVGRLLQMYASCIQTDDYADNCEKYGRGADYVAMLHDLIEQLDPRHFELLKALRAIYLEQGDALSEVMERTAGTRLLTPNRLYLPVVPLRDRNVGKAGEGRAYSPFAPSLVPRVKHGLDFDQTADIIEVFLDRAEDAAHTVGWAETGSLVAGICQSDRILNAIRKAHGRTVMSQWNNYILDILAGTRATNPGAESKWVNFLARLASWTWIGLNPVSWVKQLESVLTFALSAQGSVKDVVCSGAFWTLHPIDAFRVAKDLSETAAFRARYGLAISQELKYATSDEGVFKTWMSKSKNKTLSGVYGFDKLCVYLLAGVYRRRRAMLEKDGMAPAEASETAASWLMHIVDKTAQTARTLNTTQIQRAGGAWALVLQFKSAPAQQTQFEITAVQEALAKPNDAKRWRKAAAVLAINHLIIPAVNTMIEAALMTLTGWGLPDEEKRKRLAAIFAANVLSGSLGSIAFLGTAVEGAASALSDWAITGRKPSGHTIKNQPVPAFTLLEHWWNSGNKAIRACEELNDGDIADAIIDMATAIGGVIPGVSWPARTAGKTIKAIRDKED